MSTSLSRDEMEAVIRGGGSVLHKGQHLTRIEHLPSEADLAEGDAAASQAALDGITAQRAALDEQERKLLGSIGTSRRGKSKKDNAAPNTDASGEGTGDEGKAATDDGKDASGEGA